ncbi:hypothetical protein BKA63DRAFT_194159 [Paraphoma chrysanthemicola]|nr:hypothetical protein BKA63DRAFT_194159 [Paraphoma chrysanthemicola]
MRRLLEFCSEKKSKTKTPAESSATSASSEPAATVIHGLQVLCEGTNPIVDIVAVHGLNGHCEKTWTAGNGVNWLHDLPNARILSWGYDANTHSSSRVSTQYLYDHGRGLVSDLCFREGGHADKQMTDHLCGA